MHLASSLFSPHVLSTLFLDVSVYIVPQFERPSFTPRCFVLYVMCVAFILEYNLLFFMQHKVLEVTYFFHAFVHHVCMSVFYLVMVLRCSFFNQWCYELLSEMDG